MFKSCMIEREKDLRCSNNHKQPILMVVLDPKLELNQRLLCADCIKGFKTNVTTMGYELVCKTIRENQNQKIETIEKLVQQNVIQIEELLGNIHKLKSQIAFQLDEIIGFSSGWIQNLQQVGHDHSHYSFHAELRNIITKSLENKNDKSILINEINTVNDFWKLKINEKLELLNNFKQYQKCQEILLNINRQIDVKEEGIQSQKLSQQKELQIQSVQDLCQSQNRINLEDQIQIQLKDDFIKQNNKCYAIAFNKSGSQMVSMNNFDIRIWTMNEGKLNLESTLYGHSSYIYCLIYSKLQESFISSSNDKTIICWKKINQNDWKKSHQYRQHKGWIGSMVLNKNETQLFSGGGDFQIIVWQVDLNQNELQYLYSLEKHTNSIRAISLNDSENVFISCGDDQQIIIWEIGQHNKFQFKQVFTQFINSTGCHLKFLNDNQFIWVPYSKELNFICMFQQKLGIFTEDTENRIQLNSNNNKNVGCSLFPIVYLKDKNALFIRSKNIIYILRELDGKFLVVNQLNCITNWNFGTVTDDGKYLVVWDDHKKGYQSIELSYK
ncbi:unnamed protein product [Paramecium sonneborni]|uniref:WD40-repeat-containing domain n=1 Tax=Paramecium sonneborni TaxID=65129 RepID=A0A8S1PP04_9CILI|nr:unnamed protein product [Paramecium sonneborni]